MRSFFVRHTSVLRVSDEDLRRFWREDRIAVHYPDEASGLGPDDSRNTVPELYAGKGKTAMRYLHELLENGGYVWAESLVAEDGAANGRRFRGPLRAGPGYPYTRSPGPPSCSYT